MENKNFCLERLDSLIEHINAAKTYESRLYFATKAEGFVDALFYADVLNDAEFKTYYVKIENAYLRK